MNHKKLNTRFDKLELRIDKVIHLGVSILEDSINPELAKALSEDYDELTELLGFSYNLTGLDCDYLLGRFKSNNKLGFLMLASTPIVIYTSKNSASYSWGTYASKWVYSENYLDCLSQAQEFRELLRQACRKFYEEEGYQNDI